METPAALAAVEAATMANSQSQPPTIPEDGPTLHQPNTLPDPSHSNGGGVSEHELSAEEVKGVLEIIASTGKFWHNWEELKSMLFFQLKQVLSEYPEAKMGEGPQTFSLGESYPHLVRRLEEALFGFIEGPPFTLQRLCEILLNARTIYPNLSKLALALEKNLLVTSTLTKSMDPYPPSIVQHEEHIEDAQPQPQPEPQPQPQPQVEPQPLPLPQVEPQPLPHPQVEPQPQPHPQLEQQLEEQPHQSGLQLPEDQQCHPDSNAVENGGELMTGDRDEVMAEVEAEVDDGMTIDMETFEEIISSSETNPEAPNDS